jgi:large subunit ribosomal protein L25
MENVVNLKAESRIGVGKKIARNLRKAGKIPAIIYGLDKESIPISLSLDDIKNILKMEKGQNTILRIERDDKIHVEAMLKEIQYDYLSDNIIHADFIRIDLNKPIDVSVPVVAKGEPIGVRVEDGIFDFITRHVEVRCLPTMIPSEIKIDVSDLHSGHSIKVEELEVGEGVQFISDPNIVICAVNAKRGVEELAEVEEEAPEEEAAAEEKPEESEAEDKKEGE